MSYKKEIYRAAVSQRLRNTVLNYISLLHDSPSDAHELLTFGVKSHVM